LNPEDKTPFNKESAVKRVMALANQNEEYKRIALLARKCMANSDFQHYKEEFTKAEGMIMKQLRQLRDVDNHIYANNVRLIFAKLDVLSWLIDMVENDATRKVD